jgi:hypothetical protein
MFTVNEKTGSINRNRDLKTNAGLVKQFSGRVFA